MINFGNLMTNKFFEPRFNVSLENSDSINQAKEKLLKLERLIQERRLRLEALSLFLNKQKTIYTQLDNDHKKNPSDELALEITTLKTQIEKREEALERLKPETQIANLESQYNELKNQIITIESSRNDYTSRHSS